MRNIDDIIKEEVDAFLINEGIIDSVRGFIKKAIEKYISKKDKKKQHHEKTSDEKREERKEKKRKEKKKKKNRKIRKTVKGGREYYDYDNYEKHNRKISKGDADAIRNSIDQINTDIAAVARIVFPKHTDEGAQSQLRKILNGERPMTKKVAATLEKLISAGKIATK